ncbi:hypothetical protein MSG28_000331 [Choristoneura fumiferana]|uniref:Uncharacterized protein n=1 Tax=Choristoneura fumiferana TaxID=7141 RepID=A0ACC0K063_CHOFU|nr:hypothetical protein MSG28_000331 [Choristoneura fumiferana]
MSVNPMVAPTTECVPDTGSRSAVASSSQTALANSADRQPSANSRSPPSSYNLTSSMPLRIVSDTLYPAPAISKMVARTHACVRVSTLEPTLVPKELATSFAPIPNANTKATTKPASTIQSISGVNGSIVTADYSYT